jgi:undecaprenyl-diphosphatase
MLQALRSLSLARLSALDWALCLRVNRASHAPWVRQLMRAVSRLGDGGGWACLLLAMLVATGADAVPVALHGVGVGAVCYALYTVLKRKTTRPRPYAVHAEILRCSDPLDQYSFPSGHTMQAVALTIVLGAAYPGLIWLLAPFTALVAVSRVSVGLHYPSDVVAGGLLGALVGSLFLAL